MILQKGRRNTVNKNLSAPDVKVTEVEINTITLRTIIEKYSISKIDVMKIDVETHEVEVLKGMGDYLQKFKPAMLIEILNNTVAEGIEKLISGMDYLYFNIDENGSINQTEHILKSDCFNYLLCSKNYRQNLIM